MEYKYDKKVVNKLIDDAMKSWTKCHYVNEPKEGPLFITKEGKIIWGETTHSSIVDKLGIGLFYATKIEGLTYLTMWEFFEKELGWIRCNSGTLGYEGTTYIAIDKDAKPTEQQYTTLEDVIYYYFGTLKKKYVEVWIVSNGSSNVDEKQNYYQEYDTPEDVIKSIKRYFQNGLLEGFLLHEVYPNKGESKKDFIKRFMSVTAKEYPDEKQRFAVANSYWERRHKKVNEELSQETDNEGNVLSKEQVEFFKNSKVRDKDGRLIVCYHGTPNPGFKEFNPKSNKSQFGGYKFDNYNVNYFTTDKDAAVSFTEIGVERDGNVYACYLNIVNPYVVNNKTEASLRTSFNIKDDELRKHQLELFDKIFNKWKGRFISYGDYEFKELNKDLHTLNLELRPSEIYSNDAEDEDIDIFDLFYLGNNSFFGAEHPIEPSYTVDELFDDDMYDQLKEDILGISEEYGDDYFFSTDDIVRYVISLNETKGTNYDGIVIPDIYDSKSMFGLKGTDYITLKSSNQIKLITNENPTTSNRIDEEKLYHGTDYTFDKFQKNRINWFTDDIKYAKSYGKNIMKKDIDTSDFINIGEINQYLDYADEEDFDENDNLIVDYSHTFVPQSLKEVADKLGVDVDELVAIYNMEGGSTEEVDGITFMIDPLYEITNSLYFYDLLKENGIKGIIATEDGITTYGVVGTKSINEELNNKDEIISVLKKTSVKEEPPSRCFILEDGTFIDVIGGDLPHAATAEYLYKLGLVDKDFITSNIKGYADDTKLISLIKAITCNGYGEFYFRLLKDRPTDAQFKSLTLWLDKYYTEHFPPYSIKAEIAKTDDLYKGEMITQLYNPKETTVDEIIKKLKKYYITGYLEESLKESLDKATPYMLRNDGALLKCGTCHPYISNVWEDKENDLDSLVNERIDELEWFYRNTKSFITKEYIETIVKSCDELGMILVGDTSNFKITDKTYSCKGNELYSILEQLSNDVNQEFCRVRTSNLKIGGDSNEIYFRISSNGFNWFPYIWIVVMKYMNNISDVTIVKDKSARDFSQGEVYKLNGKELLHIPTNEFLTLNGNPIIETKLNLKPVYNQLYEGLSKGKTISESLFDMHPRYLVDCYKGFQKEFDRYELENVLQPVNNAHVSQLNEELLLEKSRNELIRKSQKGANYKTDQSKGKNRWERKKYSKVANFVREFNSIDMNTFFKKDILNVVIPVKGETDNYQVRIKFNGVLDELRRIVKLNDNVLDYKSIMQSLTRTFNEKDVYVWCSCPDHCLKEDTKIKLLNNEVITVKELLEKFKNHEDLWVYSTDEKGDFKPGHISNVWVSGKSKTMIRITLDNGKIIETTPEHRYMLRDGSYKEAKDLTIGTSLMPLYFSYHNGYESVKSNSETPTKFYSTYKTVAKECLSNEIVKATERFTDRDSSVQIHHKDFNKLNNYPSNLQPMTNYEHWEYHYTHLKESGVLDKWLQAGKKYCAEHPEFRATQLSNLNMAHLAIKGQPLSEEHKQKLSLARQMESEDKKQQRVIKFKETLASKTKEERHKSIIKNQYNKILNIIKIIYSEGLELNEENYEIIRKRIPHNSAPKLFKYFSSIDEIKNYFDLDNLFNHKIVNIEFIEYDSPIDVYDLTVDKYNNFYVDAGVVLHNCYRFDYWCTIQDYNSGKPQLEPTDETNPGDSLGAACKHVNLVLSNLFWLMKVASVINNYIHFAEENMQRQFAEIIFPTIYGVQYPKAVQIGLFDRMYLKHSKGVIDYINSQSAKGGYRKKAAKPEPEEEIKITQTFKQPNILNKTEKEEQEITNKPVQPKFTPNVNKNEQPKFSSQPKQLSLFDNEEEEITEK